MSNSSPGTGMGAYMTPAPMGPTAMPFEMGHMQMYPHFMQGTLDFSNLGGGFQRFSTIWTFWEMIQFDLRIFFRCVVQPPTSYPETNIALGNGWLEDSETLNFAPF